jgi:hypothetical protein
VKIPIYLFFLVLGAFSHFQIYSKIFGEEIFIYFKRVRDGAVGLTWDRFGNRAASGS